MLDGFEMGPIQSRGQFASLDARQYRKRDPALKLDGF